MMNWYTAKGAAYPAVRPRSLKIRVALTGPATLSRLQPFGATRLQQAWCSVSLLYTLGDPFSEARASMQKKSDPPSGVVDSPPGEVEWKASDVEMTCTPPQVDTVHSEPVIITECRL